MSLITRRSFLGGLAAMPFMPATKVLAGLPVNPGIVIIGGGIAGLTAARTLIDKGYNCIVLEAKDHLGGRAYTESETFGFPYDHGANWIHSADLNPLSDLIRSHRFEVVNDSEKDTWVYLDGKEATAAEYERIGKSLKALSYKIDYGSDYYEKFGRDVSLRDLEPPKSRYDTIAQATLGPLVNGSETYRVSLYDTFQQTNTGVEWMVPDGMGRAIVKSLGEVPVSLSTPVRNIDWYNLDVVVETDIGNITTRGVIVTVPPQLIFDRKLRFDPELPSWKTGAIDALPISILDKVAFTFKPGTLDNIPESTSILIQNGAKGPVWEFLMRPFGRDMAVGFIGGRGAIIMKTQGAEGAHRAGLGALMSALGPGIKDAVLKSHYTDWGNDPWARGSFSIQKPGFTDAREQMGKPISQRLFFAGEATSVEWAGSATGAYLSGIRAANEVIRWVTME